MDVLSLLTHSTLPLAKTWLADGTIADYAKPKNFRLTTTEIHNIHDLSTTLTVLEKRTRTCMIRGRYIGDNAADTMRRKDVFEDQPLHTVLIEVDKYPVNGVDPFKDPARAFDSYIANALPPAFHDVSYHWQFSNSAGHPSKLTVLKAHLWFFLKTPYTSAQLKAWAVNNGLTDKLDISVFDTIQVHYTAAPVFEPGVVDPVPVRSGLAQGLSDTVDLALDEDSLKAEARSVPTGEGYKGDDPTALWLEANGLAKGVGASGQVLLDCPFAADHTDGRVGDSDTTYLPARPGFPDGVFHCSHASCAKRESAEFESAFGSAAAFFSCVEPEPQTPEEKAKKARFELVDFTEFSNRPPLKWLIRNAIPKAELGIIFGPSTAGKSFVALDMAFAIARGISWCGKDVEKGRVVYIAAEGAIGMQKRVKAYALQYQVTEADLQIIPDTPNLILKPDVDAVIKSVLTRGKADMIVIDTLAQTTPGADENAGKDMGPFLANVQRICRETGAVALVVHHSGKDATKGSRGWSGIKCNVDFEIEVSRDGENRTITFTKLKDDKDGEQIGFRLQTVPVGMDEKDRIIESCVVSFTKFLAPPEGTENFGHGQNLILCAPNGRSSSGLGALRSP